MDLLLKSFQENSIIWIIISAGVGGFIGATIKFLFEQILVTRYQRSLAARDALRKYTYPILRAADSLDRRMENLTRFVDRKWFDDPSDDYYRVSTLYLLGAYLGWCKILENEAFLEYETSDKRAKEFSILFNRVFKGLTGFYYFQDLEEEMPDVEAASVPRLALTAVGELMIKQSDRDKSHSVLDFVEFVESYKNEAKFKRWFSYLEKLLAGINRSISDAQWNRVLVFATNLRVFVSYLDRTQRQTAPRLIYYHKRLHPKVRALVCKEIEEEGYAELLAS